MSSTKPLTASAEPDSSAADAVDATAWLRANWVTVAAMLGLVLQLWWRGVLIAHEYFSQGDFLLIDRARGRRLTLAYLLSPVHGQIAPGRQLIAWLEANSALYNWQAASAVTLVLLAASGLALFRLLRTIFGGRPAILVPFALYLATPIALPSLAWWSASIGYLPFALATFLAINAHVHCVRTERYWHAAVAAWWMAVGALFVEKAVLLPLVLFGLTSAFLLPGGWFKNFVWTLRRHWTAWMTYVGLLAVYIGIAWFQISRSAFSPAPMRAGSALTFASSFVRLGGAPGLLGGPWRWWSSGSYAIAIQTPVLTELSWLAVIAVVVASAWFRRRAWVSWLMLAAWLAIADLLPILAGWEGSVVTPGSAADLNYMADSVPLLVICVGLAFWPAIGEDRPYRAKLPGSQARIAITLNLAAAVFISSLWSAHAYQRVTTGAAARSYIATARAAFSQAPAGSTIVSTPAAAAVMNPAFFGSASFTSNVLGPLAPHSARIRWTTSPSGPVRNLMIFDGEGRLWPAIVSGASAVLSAPNSCWIVPRRPTRIALQRGLYDWTWFVQLGYTGPATTLAVQFGGAWHRISLPAGRDDVVFPAPGKGTTVTVMDTGSATRGCVRYLTVGTMQASAYGQPVPAAPVSR